jgi:glucose-6-phosphate 1-epimerase
VAREQVTESDAVSVTLRLSPEPDVHEMWPHAFVVELDIVLSDVLVTTMRVANGDAEPFEFFSALHTYFNIGDITRCSVRGLQGNRYVDFLRGRQPFHEERDLITFESAVDRAYSTSPETVLIDAPATGFQFSVTKQGFADTVVWNPWKEGNAAISDLGTDDYQRMVCVEAANALEPVTLAPGAVHTSAQVFRVVAAS